MVRKKVPTNLGMYVRNQKWLEVKEDKLKRDRSVKEEKSKQGLTFKPKIKKMVRERVVAKADLNMKQLRAISPVITIPQDT